MSQIKDKNIIMTKDLFVSFYKELQKSLFKKIHYDFIINLDNEFMIFRKLDRQPHIVELQRRNFKRMAQCY